MRKCKFKLFLGCGLILLFALWTTIITLVNVEPIGPLESYVGLAVLNQYFHNCIGVNMVLYVITDWLGLVPLAVVLGFAVAGLVQWIKRKHLFKVDRDILALGVFYVVVFACYMLFEELRINYRPILIAGILEASYPSSTTMLTLCVMPVTALQVQKRVTSRGVRIILIAMIVLFSLFMLFGRVISGVHWITDIIGGCLLSAGLVLLYSYF